MSNSSSSKITITKGGLDGGDNMYDALATSPTTMSGTATSSTALMGGRKRKTMRKKGKKTHRKRSTRRR